MAFRHVSHVFKMINCQGHNRLFNKFGNRGVDLIPCDIIVNFVFAIFQRHEPAILRLISQCLAAVKSGQLIRNGVHHK